jgi:hypothetical protein
MYIKKKRGVFLGRRFGRDGLCTFGCIPQRFESASAELNIVVYKNPHLFYFVYYLFLLCIRTTFTWSQAHLLENLQTAIMVVNKLKTEYPAPSTLPNPYVFTATPVPPASAGSAW